MDNREACRRMSSFMTTYFPSERQLESPEFYHWKIFETPLGPGRLDLEMENEEIAASTSITPKPVYIHGRENRSAEIGDTFTHPSHRRKGLFTKKVRACLEWSDDQGIQMIYGTPNDQSLPGYENKLDFPQCPGAGVADLAKEIDPLLLREKFRRKIPFRPLADLMGDLYWFLLKRKKAGAEKLKARLIWCELSEFPNGLDGKWGANRENYAFFMKRDTNYLNWRFMENPNEYRIFMGFKGSEPAAYFVTKLQKQADYQVGYLCDYVTLNDDQELFTSLMAKAEEVLVQQGAGLMELYASQSSTYHDTAVGLGYRRIGTIVVIVYRGNQVGADLLTSKARWHFTMADADGV